MKLYRINLILSNKICWLEINFARYGYTSAHSFELELNPEGA